MIYVATIATLMIMISVGIRDLKNQLSFYLRLVKNGESILVTERNKVIAELVQHKDEPARPVFEKKLDKLELEGALIRAKRSESRIENILKESLSGDELLNWKTIYNQQREDRDL